MKNDHRVRLTKLLLRNSFLQMLREMPASKMNVRDLCDRSGVNRATFYAHYSGIAALQTEITDELKDALLALFEKLTDMPVTDILQAILQCNAEHPDACLVIFGENSEITIDSIVQEECSRYLESLQKTGIADTEEQKLQFLFFADGLRSVIQSWFRSGMRQSPEALCKTIMAWASVLSGATTPPGFRTVFAHRRKVETHAK